VALFSHNRGFGYGYEAVRIGVKMLHPETFYIAELPNAGEITRHHVCGYLAI
jgi:hypothetical protein